MKQLNAKILNPFFVNQLISCKRCSYLDRVNIHELDIIAGPLLINNNHWLAMIIDIRYNKFFLLDPMKEPTPKLQDTFDCWVNYYASRNDRRAINWICESQSHPIQTDNYNCGVFVINFIRSYIINGNFHFETSKTSLQCDRQLISSAIENFT